MGYHVALVGTGAVGTALLEVLREREFPVDRLKLLATERSAGRRVEFAGETVVIEETTPESFRDVDLAFFAGGKASTLFAREAVERGAVVIDNGSAFRLDPDVPLIVPEVNPEAIRGHRGIIANPNCSTIQMVVALKPIHDLSPIETVVVSTYQAVSGAGTEAMEEMQQQTRDLLDGREPVIGVFPHQIGMNLIPHIDVFGDNHYTREEMKMVHETRKILAAPQMRITATAVRIPVLRSHAESILVITRDRVTREEAHRAFGSFPGLVLQDDPENQVYPMPVLASHTDPVYVGRVREDLAFENGLSFFVVADQLRKGAATNAVQTAELLLAYDLL